MASLRTQNALLFVIALCLVLIVVHLYSGHLVAKAQAANGGEYVYLNGCTSLRVSGECVGWAPVRVDSNGYLVTK